MLAASDPQLFIPFGRKQISRHVGSSTIPLAYLSYASPSFLEQELNEISLNSEAENERWLIRENSDGIEEELYIRGKVVIWSKGNFGISLANLGEDQPGGRILVRSYTVENLVKQALWCSFMSDEYSFDLKKYKKNEAEVEAICAVDERTISIYMAGCEEYFTRLPFKVSCVWSTKFGLIIERATMVSNNKPNFSSQFSNFNFFPTLFALTHPLNEMSPFLILKQGGILSFMREQYMKVVFIDKATSVCMLYDYRTALHSIWKIRRTTEEERQMMNVNQENEQTENNYTTAKQFSNSVLTNGSVPFSINNKSSVSANFTTFSSPFGGSRSNSHASVGLRNSPYASCKIESPLPAAANSSSFTTSPNNVSIKNVKFSQLFSPRLSGSPKNSPSVDARLGNSQSVSQHYVPMPVQPELCLEYIWTENSGNPRDGEMGPASSVFVSCDFVGQKHLCYLVPARGQLFCAKLEKTNEDKPDIILGSMTVIPARDAAFLPNVNATVILDSKGQVLLYSGTSQVGQILFGSISSSQCLTSSYCGTSAQCPLTPPKPARSSMLSSTRMEDEVFDEQIRQISPVKKHAFDDRFNASDLVHATGAAYMESIQDSIGVQATFKYSDGSHCRVSFPVLCTSLLVEKCLKTFQVILPREVALNFMIVWYRSRNAPGTQDISSEQEWKLFLEVFLRLLGYDINNVPLLRNVYGNQCEVPTVAKKKKEADVGSDSDWKYVLESAYHGENFIKIKNLLTPKEKETRETPKIPTASYEISPNALLYPHFRIIYFSLHLLYEEFKLNTMEYHTLSTLVPLLNQLALDLSLENFMHYYWRNHPQLISRPETLNPDTIKYQGKDSNREYFDKPPNIFEQVFQIMQNEEVSPYPFIVHVNNVSHDILQLCSLIFSSNCPSYDSIIKPVNLPRNRYPSEPLIAQYSSFSSDYKTIERVVSLMVKAGFSQNKLQNLPVGIAWPLIDLIHRCRECPREDWSSSEYDLLVREDLSSQVRQTNDPSKSTTFKSAIIPINTASWGEIKSTEANDGMEDMDDEIMRLIWPKDRRVHQVRTMLQSSLPAVIDIQHRPEVTAHEFIEEQEKHLFGICTRTMALPIGRGMFTLRTVTPSITEPLSIPKLSLIGKSASSGTSIDFSHIEVVANMNLWPLFHNGVAAGLRVSANAEVDSTWILFNRPKSGSEMLPEHAGFLMALGLNGHLKNLKRMNMFEYLSRHHEMTNVALLIGLSATFRGTMDTSTTKLLSLHIECMLPPTSLELDIDQNTQIAALLGIGLVYQGSAHRHIAEVLLSEMGRPPGPEMENCVDRESYTLSAGLALGLVLLGKGSNLSGLTDLNIADTLHYYMIGGHKRPLTGPLKEKYKSPSYQIREGDVVNVDVTSPGATLALGLMFFNTGNKAVADWMKAPDTQYILDIICPDFILLRTLARGLILWEDIIPTIEWVESHIPRSIRPFCLVKPKPNSVPSNIDLETMNQAYCNIVAGACMAIGLRFAGSANNTAFETIHYFCKIFISLFGKSISELAGKSTIENCLNVTLISLSFIMAGTGNVEVLRICRCLRSRVCQASNTVVTYGSHLATHMALGLLFFGGGRYSLSTSPESIAALIIAFYPKFPTHSNDNRYHLQAFRHLYVLAAESRLLLPRDIDNKNPVYANINMHFIDTKYYKNQQVKLMAPCLLPELKYLSKIEIKDDRYWPTVFKRGKNWTQLEQMLENSVYFDIKQRSGFLPYKEDNNNYSVVASTLIAADDCLPWSADIENMRKFTSDPCILEIMESFYDYKDTTPNDDEVKFNSLFRRIVYECITQDKLYILSFWMSMIKVLQKIRKFPNAYYAWQIKLFCQTALHCNFNDDIPSATKPLTSPELGIAVKHYLFRLMESWEKDYNLNLQSCFERTEAKHDDRYDVEQIKSIMLSIHDVPDAVDFSSFSSDFITFQNFEKSNPCPLEFFTRLRKQLPTVTLKKLCEKN